MLNHPTERTTAMKKLMMTAAMLAVTIAPWPNGTW